ncbi:MAG: multidrug efflux SMR transporter [Gammaproteobacteria bacterium]
MAWVHLLLAIAFEIAGTTSMKLSNGFQNPWPTLAIFVCYGISIGFLTLAVRTIDISVAYAIWSALGMVVIATIGIVCFGESATVWKLCSIFLVILGVIGLRLSERFAA